jgi:hypothetical protein
VRVFKTRAFARFARREWIDDAALADAVGRAERGQIDADLGGGVIKQRVARRGAGRSGGFRTIIAYQAQGMSIFLYGFAKNERENISSNELKDLRKAARFYFGLNREDLETAVTAGTLMEIRDA